MQCNDIDGINASGRAPIIMQQASASARRQRHFGSGDGGGCIRLKCQLETMSMALGKASPRLGTRARGRACRRLPSRLLQPRFGCRGYRPLRLRCRRHRHCSEAAAAIAIST